MFIKEREYLVKLEMALDKLNTKDYKCFKNKL